MIGRAKSNRKTQGGVNRSVVFFLLLISASVAVAQLPTATILGVVKDSSGAVVPEGQLTARNAETGQTRTAVSGADGSYRFSALPVGIYEVRVEHPGFRAEVRSGLALTVTQEAVVNFTLAVGGMEQTIAVTAEAPLVNTTSGSLGGLVDEQRVAELPLNGRNYIDLTLLQPGIQRHGSGSPNANSMVGTWFSSNGAPIRSNNYLLDGANMVNLYGGTSASVSGTTVGVEGIREYRLVTNSFSAEYGLFMGSQMLIVSKSGTNAFHGSLFEYLRNSALDARNFFDYQTAASSRRLPPFIRNNFGGAWGGPIRKDRTFFHAVYEGVRERLGRTTITNVIPPSAKGDGGQVAQIAPVIRPLLTLYPDPNLPNNRFTFPFTQPTDENYGQVRADQTLSASDTLFVRDTVHNTELRKPLDYPQFKTLARSRLQFVTLAENHVFSPALLNTLRFSYSRAVHAGDSPSGISGPQFSFVPGLEIGRIVIGGVTTLGPPPQSTVLNKQNIFTWSDDLFSTRGRHSLKLGTLINRYQQYILSGTGSLGTIQFPNLTAFLLGQPSQVTAATPGSVFDRTYHYSTFGFYLQDDLRLRSNFTLNLGLRHEFNTVIQEVSGRGSALRDIQHDATMTLGSAVTGVNPSLRNLSPRFGFAWDVRGNGKTAVRGGFALLYDIGNLGSALTTVVVANPPFSSASTVQNPPTLTLPLSFSPASVGKSMRAFDYLIQQPHMLQYNFTVERQLPFEMALSLAYGGSRGLNLMIQNDGNPTVPQVLPDGRKFWTGRESRTNPNWDDISFANAASNSWYNSLQAGLSKRLTKGLQFQSSYTWSKFLDEPQGQIGSDVVSSSIIPPDPSNLKLDKALSSLDIAHNWRFNAIYRLPQFPSSPGALGKVVNGWWVSSIVSLQSGSPFSAVLGTNRSRSRAGGGGSGRDRPDLVPGRNNANIVRGGPDRYFDSSAFAIPPEGFLGTAGRNILRGPGLANLDFSLAKDTALRWLGESGRLEFRAEFFNFLNHTNFTAPGTGAANSSNTAAIVYAARSDVEAPLATAGRITSTSNTSRQIQFALKLLF